MELRIGIPVYLVFHHGHNWREELAVFKYFFFIPGFRSFRMPVGSGKSLTSPLVNYESFRAKTFLALENVFSLYTRILCVIFHLKLILILI
jgi:hypothetical protein